MSIGISPRKRQKGFPGNQVLRSIFGEAVIRVYRNPLVEFERVAFVASSAR